MTVYCDIGRVTNQRRVGFMVSEGVSKEGKRVDRRSQRKACKRLREND